MSSDILATNYDCNNPKQLFFDYLKLFKRLRPNRLNLYTDDNKQNFKTNFTRIFLKLTQDQQTFFITKIYLLWVGTNNTSSGTSCNVKNIQGTSCNNNGIDRSVCITSTSNQLGDGLWLRLGSFDTALVEPCSKIDLTTLATNMGIELNQDNKLNSFGQFMTTIDPGEKNKSIPDTPAPSLISDSTSSPINNRILIKPDNGNPSSHLNFIRKFKPSEKSCEFSVYTSGLAT